MEGVLNLLMICLLMVLWARGICEDDAAIYIVTMKQAPAAHRSGDVRRFGGSWIRNRVSGTMNKLNKPNG